MALATGCLASTALSSAAWAQDTGTETLPPVRRQLDENRVNVPRGTQVIYATELSICPSDAGGLELVRGGGPGVDLSSYGSQLTLGTQVSATLGLHTLVFKVSGSTYSPADGSGTSLIKNGDNTFTLTLENGATVLLRQVQASPAQILLGHTKIETTVRYLGVEVEDALALAEATEM